MKDFFKWLRGEKKKKKNDFFTAQTFDRKTVIIDLMQITRVHFACVTVDCTHKEWIATGVFKTEHELSCDSLRMLIDVLERMDLEPPLNLNSSRLYLNLFPTEEDVKKYNDYEDSLPIDVVNFLKHREK